jgi:hypothetical protein
MIDISTLPLLKGKKALVTGIANDQSIAWGCIRIAVVKPGHEHLSKPRVKVRALQERLRGIGTGGVIDRSTAGKRGMRPDGAAAVELVTARTGTFENA